MSKIITAFCAAALLMAATTGHANVALRPIQDSSTYDASYINNVTAAMQNDPPIGVVITWPANSNPEGFDRGEWLECNGKPVPNGSAYAPLRAIVGNNLPDYTGLFLRGGGGNAGGVGRRQEQAVYIPKESSRIALPLKTVPVSPYDPDNVSFYSSNTYKCYSGTHPCMTKGIRSARTSAENRKIWSDITNALLVDDTFGWTEYLEMKNIDSSIAETRPVNASVRYFIRALP